MNWSTHAMNTLLLEGDLLVLGDYKLIHVYRHAMSYCCSGRGTCTERGVTLYNLSESY